MIRTNASSNDRTGANGTGPRADPAAATGSSAELGSRQKSSAGMAGGPDSQIPLAPLAPGQSGAGGSLSALDDDQLMALQEKVSLVAQAFEAASNVSKHYNDVAMNVISNMK